MDQLVALNLPMPSLYELQQVFFNENTGKMYLFEKKVKMSTRNCSKYRRLM